ERPYKCRKCGKGSDLIRHLQIHNGECSYKCSECSKAFILSCSTRLRSHPHHWRMHTHCTRVGERLCKCPACGKSFGLSSALFKHQHTHTGECPDQGSLCSNTFSPSTNMLYP
ncbi:ZN514 protein, partial [Nothocercus nigrocapillus]|nr:ZN514 protein [Nothocercus nigrocapillus]